MVSRSHEPESYFHRDDIEATEYISLSISKTVIFGDKFLARIHPLNEFRDVRPSLPRPDHENPILILFSSTIRFCSRVSTF